MAVRVKLTLQGDEAFRRALRNVSPRENPAPVRRALQRGGKLLQQSIQRRVSGPRPRNLDVVTGELRSSIDIDRSELPFAITVGTPIWWLELYITGKRGRKRDPFGPAVRELGGVMPSILVEELERELAKARGATA